MKKLLLLPLVAVAMFLGATPVDAHQGHVAEVEALLGVDLTIVDGHKVTICHRTHADTNPYVEITIDIHALVAHLELHGSVEAFLRDDKFPVDGKCEQPVVTTTTTAPPVIVEKEVIKEVEKIVEVPVPGPTMVIERTVTVPAPAAPAPAAPPAPAQELPRTGSGSILTLLGAGLTSTGLIIRRLFK